MNVVSIKQAKSLKSCIVTGRISDKGEIKTGDDWTLCNCKITDESDSIKFSLWNDEISQVDNGDYVQIHGYVKEYKGEKSLNVGKYGKIEILSESDIQAVQNVAPPSDPMVSYITNPLSDKIDTLIGITQAILHIVSDMKQEKNKENES